MIKLLTILNKITNSNLNYKADNSCIEASREYLWNRLDREGRQHLLDIINEKDLLIELEAERHFKQGFCLGLRLAVETLYPAAGEEEEEEEAESRLAKADGRFIKAIYPIAVSLYHNPVTMKNR